jgi:hypothetical protein
MINSLLPISGTVSIYRDCCIAIGDKNLSEIKVLDVAKCILTNAKLTCDAMRKGNLTYLDPIVGENACQIRALAAITSHLDLTLMGKLDILVGTIQNMLLLLNKKKNKAQNGLKGSLLEQLDNLGLSLCVSEKIDYLFRSHFLTIGKYFYINRNEKERCGIDFQNMKNRLNTCIDRGLLEKIVGIAQEKISQDSILYLQNQAETTSIKAQVSDGVIRVIPHDNLQLHSSCAFYNLKVVMLRARAMRIPILLKEHGVKNPLGMYFNSGDLSADQPIIVIECFLPKDCKKEALKEVILHYELMDLVLANVACTDLYSADDDISGLDQEDQYEILNYRALGKKLGCQTASPTVFSIAHIHAATVKEEKVV